jgi:hypothetical protein
MVNPHSVSFYGDYFMRFHLVVLFLCAGLITNSAIAQEKSIEDIQKALVASEAEAKTMRDVAVRLKEQNNELRKRVEGKEAALWDRYYKAKESEYDFQVRMMDVNTHNFGHQQIASYAILFLVVCVVLGGLFFAHVQLMAGLRPLAIPNTASTLQIAAVVPAPIDSKDAGGQVVPQTNLGTTTLAAEAGKVTVTSSVVGVIVLIISLAFLYIYTREIYHIQVIDPYRPTIADPDRLSTGLGGAKGDASAKK